MRRLLSSLFQATLGLLLVPIASHSSSSRPTTQRGISQSSSKPATKPVSQTTKPFQLHSQPPTLYPLASIMGGIQKISITGNGSRALVSTGQRLFSFKLPSLEFERSRRLTFFPPVVKKGPTAMVTKNTGLPGFLVAWNQHLEPTRIIPSEHWGFAVSPNMRFVADIRKKFNPQRIRFVLTQLQDGRVAGSQVIPARYSLFAPPLLSPHGDWIAFPTATDNKSKPTIEIWPIGSKAPSHILRWHWTGKTRIYALGVDPKGTLLAGLTRSGQFAVWKVKGWVRQRKIYLPSDARNSRNIEINSEANKIALMGRSNKIWLLSTVTRKTIKVNLPNEEYPRAIKFLPGGKRLLVGTSEGSLVLVDATTGKIIKVRPGVPKPMSAAIHRKKGVLAIGMRNKIQLWNLKTGQLSRQLSLSSKTYSSSDPITMDIDPSGKWLAVRKSYDQTHVLRLSTGKVYKAVGKSSDMNSPTALQFATNGSLFVQSKSSAMKYPIVGSSKGVAKFKLPSYALTSKLSRTGRVAALLPKSWIKVFDFSSGSIVATRKFKGSVRAIALSKDGLRVGLIVEPKSRSSMKKLLVWKIGQGILWQGNLHRGSKLLFQPHRPGLLVLDSDGISLWKKGKLTRRLCRLTRPYRIDSFRQWTLSADGRFLVTLHERKHTSLWSLDSWKLLATMVASSPKHWIVATPDGYYDSSLKATDLRSTRLSPFLFGRSKKATTKRIPGLLAQLIRGQTKFRRKNQQTCNKARPLKQQVNQNSAHFDWILRMAKSNRAQRVISCGRAGTIKIWDMDTGTIVSSLYNVASHNCLIETGGSHRLVFARKIGGVGLYSLYKGKLLKHAINPLLRSFQNIESLAINKQGKHLIVVHELGHVTFVNLRNATSKRWVKARPPSRKRAAAVTFHPDGRLAIVGYLDGRLEIYQTQTGKLLKQLKIPSKHRGLLHEVRIAKDGKHLFASTSAGVAMWNIATGSLLRFFSDPAGVGLVMALNDKGTLMATSRWDQHRVNVWDVQTGVLRSIYHGNSRAVFLAQGNETRILTGRGPDIIVRELQKGRIVKTITSHTSPVTSLGFDPSGQTLFLRWFAHRWQAKRSMITSWDITHRRVSYGLFHSSTSQHSTWLRSYRHNRLITGGGVWETNSGCKLWYALGQKGSLAAQGFFTRGPKSLDLRSLHSGRIIRRFHGFSYAPYRIRIGSSGKYLAYESIGKLEVRHFNKAKPIASFKLKGHPTVSCLALTPNGRKLITCMRGKVYIYDVAQQKLSRWFKGHQGNVHAIHMGPKGKYVVTGGSLGEVILWRPDTGVLVRKLQGSKASIRSVAIDPTGSKVAAGGDDGVVRLWDLRTGKLLYQCANCTRRN